MNLPELGIEELRKKSSKELSEIFDLPHYELRKLRGGIIYFNTLTGPNKTIEEMKEESGLESTIKVYMHALRKAGYQVKKFEIHRKISKPRKSSKSARKDKIKLLLKGNPLGYGEVIDESGMPPKSAYNCVEELVREGAISFLPFKLGRHSKTPSLYTQLGMSRGIKIFYLPGEEGLAGKKATEYLPQEEITSTMKRSLSLRLRNFPECSLEVVKEYVKKLKVTENNAQQ